MAFSECAFFHKDSKTLLVTDAVVYVSDNVPDAIPDRDLLESGDDDSFTIGALKLLNLFDIREKAKSRTRTSEFRSQSRHCPPGYHCALQQMIRLSDFRDGNGRGKNGPV